MLRSYKTSDFTQVLQLLKEANLYFEACDNREMINAKSFDDPESIVVAEIGDLVVGCMFVVFEPWAHLIYHMAVDSNFRNKGIGTALMQYAEDLIKERGGEYITGYVMSENVDALRMYERRGYEFIPEVTCIHKKL